MSATGMTTGTARQREAAGVRALVRTWVRRRVRWLGLVDALALGLCVLTAWFAGSSARWKSDVLRSGRRAVGTVASIHPYRDKGDGGDDVHIAVSGPPPFEVVVDTPHHAYRVGDQVPVFVDPSNHRHARTDRFTADDDWWTVVAGVVAVAAGAGVVTSLVAAWYLALVVVFGRSLQQTDVTAMARREFGRGQHRRILTFADTDDVPWSTTLHERVMCYGRAYVAGRRVWRLVVFPAGVRPYVLRRPRTPLGRSLWRRALRTRR